MSAGATAGGSAAAAAAAAEAARRVEEEEMTSYEADDLAEGWEFKIIRSNMASFRDPTKLRACLDAEAAAGWTLVEKFDDSRLRLKRPASARAKDGTLDFDAYRSRYGIGDGRLAAVILAVIVLCLTAFGLIVMLFLGR